MRDSHYQDLQTPTDLQTSYKPQKSIMSAFHNEISFESISGLEMLQWYCHLASTSIATYIPASMATKQQSFVNPHMHDQHYKHHHLQNAGLLIATRYCQWLAIQRQTPRISGPCKLVPCGSPGSGAGPNICASWVAHRDRFFMFLMGIMSLVSCLGLGLCYIALTRVSSEKNKHN